MTKTSAVVVSLIALLCCGLAAASVASAAGTTTASNGRCLYIISVQTGTRKDSGTDSKISVTFRSADGADQLYIDNLESWDHDNSDPFENGSLDRFQHHDRCMDLCQMLLVSSNTGDHPGWFLEFVRIEAIGDGSPGHMFDVHQWLALDEPPHQLYVERNVCGTGARAGAAII